jgi:hypothetical protein
LSRHLPWFLYRGVERLTQPFSLDELAEGIKQDSGVKPKPSSILEAVSAYYAETQTPLIYRTGYRGETAVFASDLRIYGLDHNPFPPPLDRPGRRPKRYMESERGLDSGI